MKSSIDRRATPTQFHGALRLVTTALAISLAACGGGGGNTGGGASEQQVDLSGRHYLPAAVGNRWYYADSGVASSVAVKAIGAEAVNGQTGIVLQSSDQRVVLIEDAQGVRQVPTAGTDTLTAAIGPVQLLRYPLHVGDSYTNVSKSLGALFDFDGDGVGDLTSVQDAVQVIGLEPLVTQVGALADCLHVRTTTTFTIQLSAQKRTATLTQTVNDWLAPGIGLVRSQQVLSADGNSDTFTRDIVAYGVGNLRSESVAPSATAPGITSASALGPRTSVDIVFSEDMDTDTLPSALTVVDGAGRAVTGTASVSARAIRFTPANPWTTGDFSARLAVTATDLVGNPVAATAWNFAIDATAPTVVGTQPLEGAVNVPLASGIVLKFSEPVLASSVDAGTIQVLYDGSVLTQVSYQTFGSQVTLTPQIGLARGKPYRISISGVTDLAGNPVTATELHFTTDPGRFGAPLPLPVPVPDMTVGTAVATGDVNGDGRSDVVTGTLQFVSSTAFSGWQAQLAVYRRQVDGSLGAAALLPLQAGAQALAISIGDVNGDGLNDVIVAEGEFGVEIFVQATDGRLVADQVLNTGAASRMKLADMNGDGRPDLVIFGANVVSVWLNLPGGWALDSAVTVTSYTTVRDLAVGDINGDGRPDIVFVSDSMPNFATAGILRQDSNGRLVGPEWIFDGNNETAFSLDVGDADGDGRSDIVLSLGTGLRLAKQQADGTLAPMTKIDNAAAIGTVKLADINGDGRADIVSMDGGGTLAVRLRQANGTWAAPALYPGSFLGVPPSPAALVVSDIDGDGRADVVAGGNRFIQRPVPMTSESVGRTQPAEPSDSVAWRIRAALRGASSAR